MSHLHIILLYNIIKIIRSSNILYKINSSSTQLKSNIRFFWGLYRETEIFQKKVKNIRKIVNGQPVVLKSTVIDFSRN